MFFFLFEKLTLCSLTGEEHNYASVPSTSSSLLELPKMAEDDAAMADRAQKIEQTVKRRMNIEGIRKLNEWLRAISRFCPSKKKQGENLLYE